MIECATCARFFDCKAKTVVSSCGCYFPNWDIITDMISHKIVLELITKGCEEDA